MARFARARIDGKDITVRDGLPVERHKHHQIRTEDDARSLANAMAETGNYPPGLDPCFTAGIDGDQVVPDHCIFDDRTFCDCRELYGFTPRTECNDHDEATHYPPSLGQ